MKSGVKLSYFDNSEVWTRYNMNLTTFAMTTTCMIGLNVRL